MDYNYVIDVITGSKVYKMDKVQYTPTQQHTGILYAYIKGVRTGQRGRKGAGNEGKREGRKREGKEAKLK